MEEKMVETTQDFTQEQLEKAVANHLKRQSYNKAWRERNPEKVKEYQKAWRKANYETQKAALAKAREAGLL